LLGKRIKVRLDFTKTVGKGERIFGLYVNNNENYNSEFDMLPSGTIGV
jgi:hypothetical protein